jgi:phosphatidylinositol alpha-1,6-mannosyltransferase
VLAGRAPGDADFDRTAGLRIERLTRPFGSWGLLSPNGWVGYGAAWRQVRGAMRVRRPQAIHCGKCLPEGLAAVLATRGGRVSSSGGQGSGLPIWCFAHGEELTLARTSRELRRLTDAVLRRATRVVANSQHTGRLLTGDWRVAPDRVVVLTPGVDTTRFVPAAADELVRARLGWSGRRVILTVGALQKRKGQDMLIRALPAIRRACPDVLYAIAGEGWERQYLVRLAGEVGVADAVRFLGVPDESEIVRLYQQCDLFALPNRQVDWDLEGFGIVLLEAQACGKPVIAGASGGTAEAIASGETGELVSCEEPATLAQACISFLENPVKRAEFGERGRQRVEQRFDWPVLARRAADLFRGGVSLSPR